eukprot:GILK01006706.1.p1 GENE.GILK01006706.1~~GILK01006706.1.p1  ORF type:complete len:701 (-),score=119.94 GILK01006706.1:216-2276(-)
MASPAAGDGVADVPDLQTEMRRLQEQVDESFRQREALLQRSRQLEDENQRLRSVVTEKFNLQIGISGADKKGAKSRRFYKPRTHTYSPVDDEKRYLETMMFLAESNADLRYRLVRLWAEEQALRDRIKSIERNQQDGESHDADIPADLLDELSGSFVQLVQSIGAASASRSVTGPSTLKEKKDARQKYEALLRQWQTAISHTPNPTTEEKFVHEVLEQRLTEIIANIRKEETQAEGKGEFVIDEDLPEYECKEPYMFDVEDSADNIRFSADEVSGNAQAGPQIRCATLNKLVERMTHEKYQDLNIRYAFLLTYRSFAEPAELLDKLIHRFYVPIPPNMTPKEIEFFKAKKQAPIQIKVFSVLKCWLSDHFYDFEGDANLKQKFIECVDGMKKYRHGPWTAKSSSQLLKLYKRMEEGEGLQVQTSNIRERPILPSGGITSADLVRNGIFNLSPVEVARQLTLIDFKNFKKIRPWECLNQGWTKKDKHILAPSIVRIADRFNQISRWVATEILKCEETSKRVTAVKYFIKVAQQCHQLHNYNSLYGIFSGLNCTPVFRLQKTTWSQLSKRKMEVYDKIKDLFALKDNQRRLREELKYAVAPCIPHLAIFLGDLYFIEDGNKDMLDSMINFFKRRKLGSVIEMIKCYQLTAYQFEPVGPLQEYLENLESMDEDPLYAISYRIEERAKNP